MCKLGATNADLADFFEVSTATIWHWSCQHPKFLSAQKIGKGVYDDVVERSLHHRARGYSYDEEISSVNEETGETEVKRVRKHIPPDTTACIFWLKNRRRERWRDRPDEDGVASGGIQISGGFSGTVVVKKADGDQVPDPAPEPVEGVRGVQD
jgi:hypothetical protein